MINNDIISNNNLITLGRSVVKIFVKILIFPKDVKRKIIFQLFLCSVIRREVIRWVVSVVLNIIAVFCIVTIIVLTSHHSEPHTDSEATLVLMLVLVCAGLARMYLCLPQTGDPPSPRSDSARGLVEQLVTVSSTTARLRQEQSELGLGNHFMSGYFR